MAAVPGLCLVGTGAIAADHMQAFDQLGFGERHWAISRRPEAAEEFAKAWEFDRWGIRLEEALEDTRVSLVVITSPNQLHVEQATMALRASKDVVLEIPASMALAEVEQLRRLAATTGRRLFVCHTMRSFPAILEIKRRIEAEELDVTQVCGFFSIPRRNNQGWKGPRSWTDNLFWHHACHQVDTTLWVMGADLVSRPLVHEGKFHSELPMVMDLSLSFTCGNGVIVNHSLTYNCDHFLWELRFIGGRNVVIFSNGSLLDESGSVIVEEHSIRDLFPQNEDIAYALSTGRDSRFDVDAVMPAYRALHSLESTLASRR